MKLNLIRLAIIISAVIFTSNAYSATYNLSWDGDGRTTIDGNSFCSGRCQPGDVIILPPGLTNDSLYINNLTGSASNPIEIRNTAGARTTIDTNRVITNPVNGNGLWIQRSRYVKIDGSNGYDESDEDNLSYGIRITDCAYRGIFLNQNSQEIEIQYVQIDSIWTNGNFGDLGVGIKEESFIGQNELAEDDVMSGLYIHHSYLFNIGREAMYLGASGACGSVPLSECCDSKDDSDDVPIWDRVHVYKNIVNNTGWDGISSSCCRTTLIYENLITNAGLDDFGGLGQGLGLALNKGFGGSAYGNIIIGAQKEGIHWQGTSATDIYNNVIVDAGKHTGARSYERVGLADSGKSWAHLTVRYNTFVNIPEQAIALSADQQGTVQDNLFVNIGASNLYGSANAANAGVVKASVQEVQFEDPSNHVYDLTQASPNDVKSSGQASNFPSVDIEGFARSSGKVDVGAYQSPQPLVVDNSLGSPQGLEVRPPNSSSN